MSILDKNLVLVSSVIVFRVDKESKKDYWFIVKNSDDDEWQFPRTVVRKGESSVRAGIRMMGEQGAMTIRMIEEAGRAGGVTTINDKTLPQRHLYYVAKLVSESGEAVGFEEGEWLEYAKATRKFASKREKQMLQGARDEVKKWRKQREEKKKKAKLKEQASL